MKKSEISAKTRIKRLCLALLVFVLVYTVVSAALTAAVYRGVFRHIRPGEIDFGYGYEDIGAAPEREKVSFPSGKNVLQGYYYRAENAVGTLIFANGINGTAESHIAEIVRFTESGWQVLIYSGTGVGDSGGESLVGLSQSRCDLLSALDFANENCKPPFVLYGHSAGGYAAATLLDDERVSAAVCVSGFDSPLDMMKQKAEEKVGFLADIEMPFLRLHHYFVFGRDGFLTAAEQIGNSDKPAYVISARDDSIVPYEISISAEKDSVKNKNAVFFKYDGDHSTLWLSESARQYTEKVYGEYGELKTKCGGSVPEDKKQSFIAAVDKDRAQALDTDYFENVLSFLNNAIK